MAISVKLITLWRGEIDNRPGQLAAVLAPLAESGADLQVVMAYRFPGDERHAAVEIYPVSGKRLTAAAQRGGLAAASFPALLVQGDNKAGMGSKLARAVADAGINMSFLVAQTVGRKFSAVFGFDSDADARNASAVIKRAARR